jgi:hypothetical protein
MPMSTRSFAQLAPVLLLGLFPVSSLHAQNMATTVTLETWQRAADPHTPGWSREVLLGTMLKATRVEALDRQQMLAMLGPPGFASESYYPGQGLVARIDHYRLSAKNNRSYRVDYDPSGKVLNNAIEGSPCACPLCRGLFDNTDIIVEDAAVTDLLTDKIVSDDHRNILVTELEQLVGHAGKRSSASSTVGGQVWRNYQVTWRISGGGGEHFLVGSGRVAEHAWQSYEDARVESYELITLTAECEAP